jgi:hypothetical protein
MLGAFLPVLVGARAGSNRAVETARQLPSGGAGGGSAGIFILRRRPPFSSSKKSDMPPKKKIEDENL